MQVRAAIAADRPAVTALWRAAGLVVAHNPPDSDFDRALAGPQSTVLIGEIEGVLAASCMVGDDGHRGWIYYVSVDPARSGQGLGRAIMAAAADWLRLRGCRKVELMVRKSNAQANGFYAALDWAEEPVTVFSQWLSPKFPEGER